MKIVNRNTFLLMPEKTVYCKYSSGGNLGEISIKYNTYFDDDNEPIDWVYQSLNDFWYGGSSNELFHKLEQMEATGEDVPHTLNCSSRDGLFEQDQLFAVFSKEDVENMIAILQTSLS